MNTSSNDDQITIRILAIEDNPSDVFLLQEFLQEHKRYCIELESRSLLGDGIAYLETQDVDVVLLDLNLPDSVGLESLERLQQGFPLVPIVVVTGHDDDVLALQAVRQGAQDFLVKDKFDSYWLPRILGYAIERKETERSLRSLAQFADQNPNPVLRVEERCHILYGNRASEALLEVWGVAVGQCLPTFWLEQLSLVLELGVSQMVEHCVGQKYYRFQLAPIHDTRQVYIYGEDITQSRLAEEKLHHAALHDALTNLPNRTLFLQNLTQAIARSARRQELHFAVLFVDLDRFKRVNDGLGHQFGDMLLLEIAKRLLACVRTTDTVARLGGDEFVLLLNELQQQQDVNRVVQRILQSLQEPFYLESHKLTVGASIGIVLNDPSYSSPEEYLRDADNAMYRAKKSKMARYAIFDKAMHQQAMQRLQMETDLRLGIERDELVLFYQPVVDLKLDRIVGFEALIRWQHPEHGLLFPDRFISIAEESGLIIPLGWWVLRAACRQLATWRKELPPEVAEILHINVNVSARQLSVPDFPNKVLSVIEEEGAEPKQVGLEITETMLIEQADKTINILEAFQHHDIKLYMDDFGTGYSSLGYLHRFPVDLLKIDRSFVNDMTPTNGQGTLVRAILSLADNFDLRVVAEGVETAQQLEDLKEWGCMYAQGYFFSRPVAVDAATEMLLKPPHWISSD